MLFVLPVAGVLLRDISVEQVPGHHRRENARWLVGFPVSCYSAKIRAYCWFVFVCRLVSVSKGINNVKTVWENFRKLVVHIAANCNEECYMLGIGLGFVPHSNYRTILAPAGLHMHALLLDCLSGCFEISPAFFLVQLLHFSVQHFLFWRNRIRLSL